MSPYARFIFYWVNLAFFTRFCPLASLSDLFPTFNKIENPAGAELTAPAWRRHPATDEAAFRSGRDAKDARPGFGRIPAAQEPARGRALGVLHFKANRTELIGRAVPWCDRGLSAPPVPSRAIRTMLGRSVPFE